MKRIISLFILAVIISFPSNLFAQGCVAIRGVGGSCALNAGANAKGWQLLTNSRYFKSNKHFVGTIEQKERVENGTEVINHSFSTDVTLNRILNNRWTLAVNVPFVSNVRSSLYEHGGSAGGAAARHSTRSLGMGDLRFSADHWLLDPAKNKKGNIQLGLGIKLPTGDFRVQDYFYKLDGSYTIGPVDQSIQLGDGGTGFSLELNGFHSFNHTWSLYGSGYYLINPREHNGVSTARGGTPTATAVQYYTSVMSVPDQYMLRGGANFMSGIHTFSAGLRMEGIPSSDLIGGDKGFRRPGYVITAEPTITRATKKGFFYVSIPVALQRNRTQSYSDKLRTAATGVKVQGDAAFSDYLINAGFSIRL
ncbi:MAG: hypothetical protein ACKO6Q_02500 [Bacteroidota bacterium]